MKEKSRLILSKKNQLVRSIILSCRSVNTMKRLVALITCLLIACFVIGSVAETTKKIEWEFDKGVLRFYGNGIVPKSGPWMQYAKNTKSVVFDPGITGVKFYFKDFKNVTSISFGPDIKDLKDCHFESSKVKRVILNMKTDCYEDMVISLDAKPDIEVGNDSCYIYENGFLMTKDKETVVYYSGKGKVAIPEGVKTIRKNAFSWSDVTEVLLPDSLTTIENGAFSYSQKISKVVLRSALKELGERAFKGCKSLKTIEFLDSRIEFDDKANRSWYVFDGCASLSEIILPPMNIVPDYMFDQCKNLKVVIISEGTKKISDNVFTKTPKLEKLYIPDSVTEISDNFYDYSSNPIIICHKDSYAEKFAQEHGISYSQLVSVSHIMLSENDLSIKKGKTINISATVLPENATIKTVRSYSSNDSIATVTNGKIKAVAPGECDIVFSSNDCKRFFLR